VAAVAAPRATRSEKIGTIFESEVALRQKARVLAVYHPQENKHRWVGWVDGEIDWLASDGRWVFGWAHTRMLSLRDNDGIVIVDLQEGELRLLIANRRKGIDSGDLHALCQVTTEDRALAARFESATGNCHGITQTFTFDALERGAQGR